MEKEAFWDRLYAIKIGEMSEPEQLCFAVNWFLCEWANGHLSQYFYNSGGEQTTLLERALIAIGADNAAAIVGEARHALFGEAEAREAGLPWPLPPSKQAQLQALDRRIAAEENDVWDRLDAFAVSQGLYTVEQAD